MKHIVELIMKHMILNGLRLFTGHLPLLFFNITITSFEIISNSSNASIASCTCSLDVARSIAKHACIRTRSIFFSKITRYSVKDFEKLSSPLQFSDPILEQIRLDIGLDIPDDELEINNDIDPV